jgi:hypothetical protein
MKGIFLCMQARQDVLPGIVFFTVRVNEPKQNNCKKLVRIVNCLQARKEDTAKISPNNTQTIKWYVHSFSAVHNDMRSHTGAIMTFSKECHYFELYQAESQYK